MGRECRRVPADWEHPKRDDGTFQAIYDESFRDAAERWKKDFHDWENGIRPSYCRDDSRNMEFWEWDVGPPDREYYRPDWPEESRTHYQMYETTSEGTPISPVFDAPEPLARWLADTKASSFGGMTATYDSWLRVAQGGWAPSAIATPERGLMDGVSALSNE